MRALVILAAAALADATAKEWAFRDAARRCNAGQKDACAEVKSAWLTAVHVELQVIPRAQWAAWLHGFAP